MKKTTKEINGVLNVKLGTPFHNKTESQTFKLSHTSDVQGTDFFSEFKTVVVNIDPLNKKVFQIYSYLSFPELDLTQSKIELKKSFNDLKRYFTELYGVNVIRLDNEKQVIFSSHNNEISITLENNNLLLECTDQILRHNCYALLAAY
jgi:hypothetical protein